METVSNRIEVDVFRNPSSRTHYEWGWWYDDGIDFMTWIVIASLVWSAAKVIDNVRSGATMIETIRMNDGKLDGVCLSLACWRERRQIHI